MSSKEARCRRRTLCAALSAVLWLLAMESTALAENPAIGFLTTGETIEIIIDEPQDGHVVVEGEDLLVMGRTNIPEVPATTLANIVYVVDVSGSTASPRGQDCNGDGVADAGDDLNGDGDAGDTLDCEISGVLALNTSLGSSPDFDGGVVPFGSSGQVADVVPGPDWFFFTSPLDVDLSSNGVADIEDVVRSLDQGSVDLFTHFDVGFGTDFDEALGFMNGAFATQDPIEADIAFFLSDGFGTLSTGTGSVLEVVAANGITVNTYSVGGSASGCATNSNLRRIADATGGTCTEVSDPTQLAAALTGTTPHGIDHVEVSLDGGPPVTASLDALGNWEAVIPGAEVVGSGLVIEATVEATDGTRVTADITVDAVPLEECGPFEALRVGFLVRDQWRGFQCLHRTAHFDIYYNVSQGKKKVQVGELRVRTTEPVDVQDDWTFDEGSNTVTKMPNRVPDYVDRMAHALENAWSFYSLLGYTRPRSDDGRLDVALWDIGSFLIVPPPAGFTLPELIQMVPDAIFPEALARHETFHSFQWEYGISPNLFFLGSAEHWFVESSAEWATHVSIESSGLSGIGPATRPREEDIYAWSLEEFLSSNDRSLYRVDLTGSRHYGAFIFPEYLTSRMGGRNVVRQIWNEIRATGSALEAVENVLGSDFEGTLHDFYVASYLLSPTAPGLPADWTFNRQDAGVLQMWRDMLGSHGTGGDGRTSRLNRPRRVRTALGAGGHAVTSTHSLEDSGAVYIDLIWPPNSRGSLEVTINGVRGTLLVFDEYPDRLCASRELTSFVPETVAVDRRCDFATLVLTDPTFVPELREAVWTASFSRR